MKIVLILATLVVAVQMAEIPFADNSASDKYAVHYKSHTNSVAEARRVQNERLQQFDSTAQYSSSANNDNLSGAPLCTVHCGNNGASGVSEYASNSDVEQIDQQQLSNGNVGYVGFNDQTEQSEYNHQQNYNEQLNTQQVLQPIVAVAAVAGADEHHSSSHVSESSSASSSLTAAQQHVAPTYVAYTPSVGVAGSSAYSQQQQRYVNSAATVQQQRPIAVHVLPAAPIAYGGSSSSSDRYTSSSNHQQQQQHETVAPIAIAVTAYPASVGGNERQTIRTERITERKQTTQQPTYVSAPTTYVVAQPAASGYTSVYSQQYRNTAEQQQQQARPVVYQPVYPTYGANVQSSRQQSNNERYTASQQLQQQQPIVYTVQVPVAAPQRSTQQSSRYTSQQQQSSSSLQQQQQQPSAAFITFPAADVSSVNSNSAYVSRNSAYNQQQQQRRGSQRVGAQILQGGVVGHQSTDLYSLMSQSERLAQEQAQQSAGSSRYGSSALASENFENFGNQQHVASSSSSLFDGSSNQLALGAANGNGYGRVGGVGAIGGGNGGYVRTKQWENNEKWSSGTQFDEQGKQRTYSTLSTGESELHNVNGQSAGYKAATTTLENDGHISTYSVHT